MQAHARLLLVVAFGLATVAPGRADDVAPTSTTLPAAASAPQQTTTVKGNVPDLTGRWLALAQLHIGQRIRVSPAWWEIGRKDGPLDLVMRFLNLPAPLQEALDRKNEANEEWVPSADDIALLAQSWETLPAADPKLATVDNSIIAHDAFDDTYTNEKKTKDAAWVVTQNMTFAPSASPAIRQVQVYAALAPAEKGYTGNFASTTLAAAPFPIPITFEGTFRLHSLTVPPPGPWQRLLDALSGCGRR